MPIKQKKSNKSRYLPLDEDSFMYLWCNTPHSMEPCPNCGNEQVSTHLVITTPTQLTIRYTCDKCHAKYYDSHKRTNTNSCKQ